MVTNKVSFGLILAVAALVAFGFLHSRTRSATSESRPESDAQITSVATEIQRPAPVAKADRRPHPVAAELKEKTVTPAVVESPPAATNKLERLNQIRETFRTLAAGDPANALRAAKQISDETERETALLTLVTEWTHGELGPARRRARAIDAYGLEAGLAVEIANKPELAVIWANELTEGAGRTAVLQQAAINLLDSDPSAAFAFSEQLPEADRGSFVAAVFAGWASTDTDAALKWADQLPDLTERDKAIAAIRTAAPVGIGAAMSMQDGYPVINQLLPGTPAEASGQLHPGDRIVALAQGDNSFVDAHGLQLAEVIQMVRGEPNTLLQLQVLAADAPPNSAPRVVSIFRDQIKFKR